MNQTYGNGVLPSEPCASCGRFRARLERAEKENAALREVVEAAKAPRVGAKEEK